MLILDFTKNIKGKRNKTLLNSKNKVTHDPTAEYFLRGLTLIDTLESTRLNQEDINTHLTEKFANDPTWVCTIGDAFFKTTWDKLILIQLTFLISKSKTQNNALAQESQKSLHYLIKLLDGMCAYPGQYQKASEAYLHGILDYINEEQLTEEKALSKSIRHALLTCGPYVCPTRWASIFTVFSSSHRHSTQYHQFRGLYWGTSQQFSNCLMVLLTLRERESPTITPKEEQHFVDILKKRLPCLYFLSRSCNVFDW